MNLEEATRLVLQGKLIEDYEQPLTGQISFDDLAKEKEKEYTKYETKFNLASPVKDFAAAVDYLQDDDMTKYLGDDISFKDDIVKVEWILEDEDCGKIVVMSKRDLTDTELQTLSNWIRGQNSDGLGEGFEQQDFAEVYFNPYTGDGPYTYSKAESEIEDLYDEISIDDLIDNGYLDDAMWNAVEVYKDENPEEVQDMDDDEIFDMIRDSAEDYLSDEDIEDAKYEYSQGDDQFNIENWYSPSSFDWEHNPYKLHKVQ